MDKLHYEEMVSALRKLKSEGVLQNKSIYIFGHCSASEVLADYLISNGYVITAILDNNPMKHKLKCFGIKVCAPAEILKEKVQDSIVLVVARAYATMAKQLNHLGYKGEVRKIIDYNSFAEYSLSDDTAKRMQKRLESGIRQLETLNNQYNDTFKIFCPFSALGDVYIAMSYLPYLLKKRQKTKCRIFVVSNATAQVVKLFGDYDVDVLLQQNMDEILQAVIYTHDINSYIAHQDRPYIIDLHKVMYYKFIPFNNIYCCGVFGLPKETVPVEASVFKEYNNLNEIPKNKSVIISPYAKSVTALPEMLWRQIVESYTKKGYKCFTNVVGDELPLEGTIPISPKISEMKSVVEQGGVFIGIRSGLCDVIRTVNARKIALYPEYNFCDTKWKAIDVYWLKGWDNIEVKGDFEWKI